MKYKKAILVSESNKFLLEQSKSWVLGSGIQLHWGIRNPVNDLNLAPFGIWNSMITSTWNPDSQTVSDNLTWSKFYWRQKNILPHGKITFIENREWALSTNPYFSRKPLVTESSSGYPHLLMATLARMVLWELIQHGREKVDNSKWFRKLLLVRR